MTTPQSPSSGDYPQENAPQVIYVKENRPWYKRVGCIVGLVFALSLIAIVAGCTALLGGAVNEVDKTMNEEHTVTYSIEGDAQDASVTYNVGEAQTAQDTNVAAGWSKDVKVKGFFGPYLSVTNGINESGAITCKISANGKVITENTATGEFATASCNTTGDDLRKAFEE